MSIRRQTLVDVPIERITRGEQPRTQFPQKGIEALAATLLQRGMLYPLRVRRMGDDFLLLGGERRLRAAQLLAERGVTEFQTISCMLVEGELSAAEEFEEKLVDNLHREDLDPIDEANGYAHMMELLGMEDDTQALARHLHLTHQRVKDSLSLLSLPDNLQTRIRVGDLAKASAVEIAKIEGNPDQQQEVARLAIDEGVPVKTIKAIVARKRGAKPKRKPGRNRTVFKVGKGATVVVRTRENHGDTGVLQTIQVAERMAHADVMDSTEATTPTTIAWKHLFELVMEFNNPVFGFALVGLTRRFAGPLISGLVQLVNHEDKDVREQAEKIFANLSPSTKETIAHLLPHK